MVAEQTGQRGLYVLTDITEAISTGMLLALAALVWLVGWLIGRSRLGFALRIIGDDETVARHSGINTALPRCCCSWCRAAVAAVVGAILAPRYVYIEPRSPFTPILSFQVVIMALLGGAGRLWGPICGVIPFTLLWEVDLVQLSRNQTTLLLGVAFLLIVYVHARRLRGPLDDRTRARMIARREGRHDTRTVLSVRMSPSGSAVWSR
jgi:branched-chain amino acid transport system permease protein